jgi:hypothetical protein
MDKRTGRTRGQTTALDSTIASNDSVGSLFSARRVQRPRLARLRAADRGAVVVGGRGGYKIAQIFAGEQAAGWQRRPGGERGTIRGQKSARGAERGRVKKLDGGEARAPRAYKSRSSRRPLGDGCVAAGGIPAPSRSCTAACSSPSHPAPRQPISPARPT